MTTQIKTYPIVENAINLFGDWLQHQREMRELRDMKTAAISHALPGTFV